MLQFYSRAGGFSLGFYAEVSLGALGIMPFIAASVLVELFHALLHWSRRRGLQPRDRSRLPRIVIGVTAALCALRGWSIALYLESMRMPGGAPLVAEPGVAFRLMVVVTLIAVTLLLVWLARVVTRHGLGNGVALLMLFSLITPLWRSWGPMLVQGFQRDLIELGGFVLIIAVAAGLFYGLHRFERWHVDLEVPRGVDKDPLRWKLKGNPAGIVPRSLASQVMWLPLIVAGLFEAEQWVVEVWNPDHWVFEVAFLVLVAVLAWPYAQLTASPDRLAAMLERTGLSFDGAMERLQRAHRKRFGLGLAYILIVSVIAIAQRHFGAVGLTATAQQRLESLWFLTQLLTVVTALYILVIVVDLIDEVAFRRRVPRACVVLVEHEIHAAKLVQAVLEQGNGIPCLIQAYHARALETFFGPYLDLAIWVPEDRAEQAREILVEINAPLT